MPVDVVHTDLSQVSKSLAVTGGFIVIYGLISYVVKERLYISEPLLAVTVGILVGPYALNWVDPLSWGSTDETNYLTYEFTRIIVGIQVLFCGISLPKAYLWREKLSLAVLLVPVMTTAWIVVALLIWGLIPDLTFLESLAISAAITPTDPVLANSITNGRFAEKHVPLNVRNIIVAESGANDGLGFPFLFIALYLLARKGEDAGTSIGTEIGRWFYAVVIYQVILSICFGALVGYLARRTLRWAESRSYIDSANFFAYGLGLAFFTLGLTGLFGSDDILACFIAGNSFTWDDWFRLRTEDNDFQEIIDSVLNLAIFLNIGAIIPWADFNSAEINLSAWRLVLLGICILLLRRPPWVVAMTHLIPALRDYKESAFAGFFGPIGCSALFYVEVALREIPEDGTRDRLRRVYAPVVFFCIFSSVFVHGITIPISKLGPRVVKKTATLTQNKTITFSRSTTTVVKNTVEQNQQNGESAVLAAMHSGGQAQQDANVQHEHTKELWNPLVSLRDGLVHVGLFWRKDSFWRREPRSPATSHASRARFEAHDHTSTAEKRAPVSDPAQPGFGSGSAPSSDNDGEGTPPTSSDEHEATDRIKPKHLPKPSLTLPTSHPSSAGGSPAPVTSPTFSAAAGPSVFATGVAPTRPPTAAAAVGSTIKARRPSGGNMVMRALDREILRERDEAALEAQRGWQRGKKKEQKRLNDLKQARGELAREEEEERAMTANTERAQQPQ